MDRAETAIIEAPLLHQTLDQLCLALWSERKRLQDRGELHGSEVGSDAAESYAECGYEPAKPRAMGLGQLLR